MQNAVTSIRSERRRVIDALRSIGLAPARSGANFVFFDCQQDSASVAQHLLMKGIIIKPWREPGYQTYIRATIGLPTENDRFVTALAETCTAKRP